jgi:hypothetical protein
MLRSQVLADEKDSVFGERHVSVDIFISRGLIGWSQVWDRYGRDSEAGRLSSAKATGSGSKARLSCESAPEITRILVNMTLGHVTHSSPTEKESKL